MRKMIVLLLIVSCSCSQRVTPVVGGANVKEKKLLKPYVFVMVTCFMLGFVITDEYLIEK